MVRVPLQSGVVNALIFVVFDVVALWAIHRGLVALQGCFLHWTAKRGTKVRLRRSRVPIFAGYFMQGVTRLPSLVLVANLQVLVLVFVAALNVNGETESTFEPVNLRSITQLGLPVDSSFRLNTRFILDCRTSNDTHIVYWPVAFDTRISTVCQKGAPGVEPMFSISDCSPVHVGCFGSRDEVINVPIQLSASEGRFTRRFGQPQSNVVWRKVNDTRESNTVAVGSFITCIRIRPTSVQWECLVLQPLPVINEFNITFGRVRSSSSRLDSGNWEVFRIIGTSATLRWELNSEDSSTTLLQDDLILFGAGMRRVNDVFDPTLAEVMDSIVTESTLAMPTDNITVYKTGNRSITEISISSIVIYTVLALLAICLFAAKECVLFVAEKIVSDSSTIRTTFDVFEYDTLSNFLRAEIDSAQDVPASGQPALLVYTNGVMRIAKVEESAAGMALET